MSNYTKTTDFEAKDSLPTGDSGKIIRGAEFETEFDAISTAIATKADTAGPTFTGTLTFETISDGTIGVTAFVDEDNMASNSATLVPTQQSVKAYVDSVTTELNAQDLDFQADSGGALNIDLDSETMTFTGGTGIDTSGSGNTVTFDIDSTVTTLTGTQTLTNKTLTAPVISGNLTTDGTIDGRDVATDGAKLDGIEAGATADQTDAEIRAAVEAATDSNVFTDADHTKLDGIEASATADQTDAEIRAAVEAATDSNVFTDADHTKLDGIEANATADQTDAEIRAAVEAATDSNVFTDADHTKLDGIEALADVTDTTNVTAAGALMDSELTNLTAVKSLDQGVATTDTPTFAGLTTTADVSFGDNDKAIFGASGDLQIYHDGSHSYIQESGTGNLFVRADNLILADGDGTQFLRGTTDADVKLYYAGSAKLTTTSTGIDVTGTVTADGLTVEANTATFSAGTSGDMELVIQADTDNNDEGDSPSLVFKQDGGNTIGRIGLIGNANDVFTGSAANALYIGNDEVANVQIYTDKKERLRIGTGGDISFYEDTGTTAKLFWDASAESLGIGTSSPDSALVVQGGQGTYAQIKDGTVTTLLQARGQDSIGVVGTLSNHGFGFFTNSTERMRIDSSGQVGIGVSSPSALLHVSASPEVVTRLTRSAGSNALVLVQDPTTTLPPYIGSYGNAMAFGRYGGGESMRIDASGNLLVGKTSADDFGSAGAQIEAGGQITNSVASAPSLRLNRGGTDGDVIEINKAGQPVGSIGSSNSGYNLFITTSDTGLAFNYLADEIVPCTANGAYRNAAIDLGDANAQFKDLYLSGGVYLGGTGSANKLDDYEEGTFTPAITFGGGNTGLSMLVNTGQYTKVGRSVYVRMQFRFSSKGSSTGSFLISGLPFMAAAVSGGFSNQGLHFINNAGFSGISDNAYGSVNENASTATIYYGANSAVILSDSNFGGDSANYWTLTGVYETA